MLDAMQRAQEAGITRERFPVDGLGHYVELLDELAKREVRMFLHRAADIPPAVVLELAERATEITEPIVAAIRRRFILRAIHTEAQKRETT
jgi:hypothetical protein